MSRKSGATPGKLLIAAVLAIALIVVVVLQLGGDDETVAEPLRLRPVARSAVSPRPVDSPRVESARATAALPAWPQFSRELAAQHDPFRLPAPLHAARAGLQVGAAAGPAQNDRRTAALDELRRQGVSFVVLAENDQHVAMIGGRQVKVGDVLEGFRVADINSDGIVLVEDEK